MASLLRACLGSSDGTPDKQLHPQQRDLKLNIEASIGGEAQQHKPAARCADHLCKDRDSAHAGPCQKHQLQAICPMGKGPALSCPLGHGSVGVGPYPGYVHGKHPEICAHGCKPDLKLGKYGRDDETPREALIREALEYQALYHKEKGTDPEKAEARKQEILAEIEATGTYTHTFDELQHGGRVAWRNAPKCSNRKFWEELDLIDCRRASTPDEMAQGCLELLERATLTCATTANIAVFRAQTPGGTDGPRVWNSQLIRFACYEMPDGSSLGDPAEKEFTAMIIREFGWVPPPPEKRTAHDVLPLLLQPHPAVRPQLYTLPEQYVAMVPITHPDIPGFASLGYKWYAVPAVSCLEMSVGGLTYTACPFNGWYSVTEIVRNLTEEHRYNCCPRVAKLMGLSTRSDDSMWRDRAIAETAAAIMHSFRQAGMGMVNHHILMRNFFTWYHKELRERGYCPGNWKWIIPPLSPTASRCYLELNTMTEYTLKPGYWFGGGWKEGMKRWKEALSGGANALPPPANISAAAAALPAPATSGAASDSDKAVAAAAGAASVLLGSSLAQAGMMVTSEVGAPTASTTSVTVAESAYDERGAPSASTVTPSAPAVIPSAPKAKVVIVYASVTGNTTKFAELVAGVLRAGASVTLLDCDCFEEDAWEAHFRAAKLLLVMLSTYGPGAPPGCAAKFVSWLGKREETGVLRDKPYAVLGFGSSSYPRFCAAADTMHGLLAAAGASPLMRVTKADAQGAEEVAVWNCVRLLSGKAVSAGLMGQEDANKIQAAAPILEDKARAGAFSPRYALGRLGRPQGMVLPEERGTAVGVVVEVRALKNLDPAAARPEAQTCLVRFDIFGNPGLMHQLPGDEVMVWGENDGELVAAFAEDAGVTDLDEWFVLQDLLAAQDPEATTTPSASSLPLLNTFRHALTAYCAISAPLTYEAATVMAAYAATDRRLAALASSFSAFKVLARIANGELDPERADDVGATLLLHAVAAGNTELVRGLVEGCGVGVGCADSLGRTPLARALQLGQAGAVKVLEGKGAPRVCAMHRAFYPLHAAVIGGDLDRVSQLLAQHHDVNAADYEGLTPLHAAAGLNHAPIARLLLERGAATDVTTHVGTLPRTVAISEQATEVADVLAAAGAPLMVSRMTAAAAGGGRQAVAGRATRAGGGISQEEVAAMQSAWAFISGTSTKGLSEEALSTVGVDLFMALFDQYPHLINLFPFKGPDGKPEMRALRVHGLKVVSTLGVVLGKLGDPQGLKRYAEDLVENHKQYGVVLKHYDMVLGVVAHVISSALTQAGAWDELQARAWTKLVGTITDLARAAYGGQEQVPAVEEGKEEK